MTASTNETEPLDVKLTGEQCEQLARAGELYCKHLTTLEEKAATLKRSAEAAKYHREIEGLREELVGTLSQGDPKQARIYPRHRPVLAKGVELLITNLRSAKGTVKPLGKDEWIQELEAEAASIETQLLPLFVDQLEMDVAAEKSKKGEGLKLLAEEDAKMTEMEIETEGTYRIGGGPKPGKPKKKKGKK